MRTVRAAAPPSPALPYGLLWVDVEGLGCGIGTGRQATRGAGPTEIEAESIEEAARIYADRRYANGASRTLRAATFDWQPRFHTFFVGPIGTGYSILVEEPAA